MVWCPKQIDEFIEYKKWFYKEFLKAYRNRVNEFYMNSYTENPDNFPFMGSTSVVTIFRNYEMVSFLSRSDFGNDNHVIKMDILDSQEEYEKIRGLPEQIQEKRVLKLAGVNEYNERILWRYGESDDPKPNYALNIPRYQGNMYADKHDRFKSNVVIQKENNTLYHEFDIVPLIAKVNNEDFQYELIESVKAYNAGLYFASTVVSAVTIETILKIYYVSHFGESSLPKKYYILNLAEKLNNENKLNDRLHHRIKSFNELRRGVAHSKTGKVSKWDAEQGLSLIKIIVESLF